MVAVRSGRSGRGFGVATLCTWLAAILFVSCAQTPPASSPSSLPGNQAEPARPARVLRVVNLGEPAHLSVKPLGGEYTPRLVTRMFNATLAYKDERGIDHPELVEALPQLGTDSWRVFPDGQMETTYKLRPNLTWHDGRPLSADDFVFAFQVYAGPELGQGRAAPQNLMRDVVAPDARTLVIRWSQPYPGADSLAPGSGSFGSPLPPMPRHVLEEPLRRGNPDAFAAHPYWTAEYVGAGPYRLDRWEPGTFLEASAFDGYVLGRPKLERVRVLFLNDPNTIVAAYLAGEADVSAENVLRIEQGVVLRQDWAARGLGNVQFFPSAGRRLDIQFHPERLKTPALQDLRVRRMLAHAVDKEALNQGLLEGLGKPSDTWVQPDDEFFPEVQRAVTKYPYDLRLAAQQLTEAGFAKGTDGVYASPMTGRLAMHVVYEANPQWDKEAVILEDGLKRFGIDITTAALSRGQARDPELRADFPAVRTQGGGQLEDMYIAAGIPSPQNRYQGNNRGSWTHPEYERLVQAFGVELDRAQRSAHFVQMAKLVSDELPAIPMFYSTKVVATVPQLQGVILGDRIGAYWNVHLWEFR